MKKVLGIILALSVVLSLGGCSNTTVGQTETEEPKSVEDQSITLTFVEDGETYEISGKYTGEMVNGKPQGEGKFVGDSDVESLSYSYEGAFEEGYYNGQGAVTVVQDGETTTWAGTFAKGEYTPTTAEKFNFAGQFDTFGTFSLSDEVKAYIASEKDLFPTADEKAIRSAKIQEYSNRKFIKTCKQEDVGPVKLTLHAAQVFENDLLGGKITSILAWDEDGYCYAIHYLDSVEVYEKDEFTVYAVPCSVACFDNVGGGTTNVTVLLACHFEGK